MNRSQTAHETLIPLLCEIIGAQKYLEFGTHANETIGKVGCPIRYGVDTAPVDCPGVQMFRMTTQEFIAKEAAALAPFDVVFIDADHHPERVMADFVGIAPYMSNEGLILLHDVNPETWADTAPGLCDNAWLAAQRLITLGAEAVVLPYHPGLMIVRKRVVWGPHK